MCFSAMGDRHVTRISVSEMKRYYMFSEWCSWLLSAAEGESLGPTTHRPFGVSRHGVLGKVRAAGCAARVSAQELLALCTAEMVLVDFLCW